MVIMNAIAPEACALREGNENGVIICFVAWFQLCSGFFQAVSRARFALLCFGSFPHLLFGLILGANPQSNDIYNQLIQLMTNSAQYNTNNIQ